ncbi:MAG: hypothetical protein IT337_11730 [Thermomicrobiales bacterium]|nr:hypothetical protein [Thermomicrobiales bacterium]
MTQDNPDGDVRRTRRLTTIAVGACIALLLAGCADDEGGHQFANAPRPTSVATPTAFAVTPPPMATPEPVKSVAFADLIAPRGGPDRVFFRAGHDLWTIGADGSEPHPVFVPESGQRIIDSSPSPSGDRVAVLIAEADGATSVKTLRPDGSVEMAREAIGRSLPDAPPEPETIDWSPQGDKLLIGFRDELLTLSAKPGPSPTPVFGDSPTLAPVGATWSPTGEEIAFLAPRAPDGARALYVAGVGSAAATPQPVLPEADDRSVLSYAWMPDGRSLLFTEGTLPGGAAASADLWRVRADGEGRELIASAGAAAPVAQIATVAPSPDGAAVAYPVTVPGETGVAFHSLWVRELATGKAYQLVIPEQQAVTDLWWTSKGLVIRTVPGETDARYDGGSFDLYLVSSPNESRLLFQAASAATPVASPAATPVIGSP